MKTTFLSFLAMGIVLSACPAMALELHTARASGAVGEKQDGYIGAIQNSPEVGNLISDVNAKRKTEYTRISKQNGQPVDIVAKLAAAQIIGKLPSGAMYQDNDGSWKKR